MNRELFDNAKALVESRKIEAVEVALQTMYGQGTDAKSIKSILKPLEDGFKESSFKDKVVQKYSTLIVFKGIIKESLNQEEQ